jgi:hypothetical protein
MDMNDLTALSDNEDFDLEPLEEKEEEEQVSVVFQNLVSERPIQRIRHWRRPIIYRTVLIDLTEESSANAEEMEVDNGHPVPVVNAPEPAEDLMVEVSYKDIAEVDRKTGNDHFKRGDYNEALYAYTRAIGKINS